MEQRALARALRSLGGGAISEKLPPPLGLAASAREFCRLWDDGSDGGLCSLWTFCWESERGGSAASAGLGEGSSSARQKKTKRRDCLYSLYNKSKFYYPKKIYMRV